MLPDFVDFMVGSGGSSFWGGNPLTDPKVSGSMVGDPSPTVGLVSSSGCGSVSGGSDELVGFSSSACTPIWSILLVTGMM